MKSNHPRRLTLCSVTLAALLLALTPPCLAQTGRATRLLDALAQTGAQVGLQVIDLADGRRLVSRNAATLLVPASTLKIFTAAAALRGLGPRFRWRTRLLIEPDGTLVLQGTGDPTLTAAGLRHLAEAAPLSGGALVIDDGSTETPLYPPGWAWDDLSTDYAPPLSNLGVNGNLATVTVQAAAVPGAPARVATDPDLGLPVTSTALTGQSDAETSVDWTRPLDGRALTVYGVVPMGCTVEGAVPVMDGSEYAARIFIRALRERGLPPPSSVRHGRATSVARPVGEVESPPLGEGVTIMLKQSDNYVAEQILRALGLPDGDRTATGLKQTAALLQTLGVKTGTFRQVDGSGLSRMNLVCPAQVVAVLCAMASDAMFVRALPIAAVDGTLAHRFACSPLRGRLRAKTGTMTGISALSGYVCDEKGRPRYAFSMMVNGHLQPSATIKHLEEEILEALFAEPPPAKHQAPDQFWVW